MRARQFVLAAAGWGLLLGCRDERIAAGESHAARSSVAPDAPGASWPPPASEPIAPVPPAPIEDPQRVRLGAALFADPVVSGDGRVSCQSCHQPEHGFADTLAVSRPAARALPMTRNTPTLLNVAQLDVFNWDGRFSSLDTHLDALLQNPLVQGTTWAALAARLDASAEWRARFARVFPDGVTAANARVALLAYERSLVSPDAPFDRWLAGDPTALGSDALEGYSLFKSRGCISCHQGALIGGNLFQRLGVIEPYYTGPAAAEDGNLGRFTVSGREEDRYVFRVPSLRNVALTAPYLHDGSLPTLEMVVSVMGTYQLGRALDPAQTERIVAFLTALTGSVAGGPR